MRLSAHSPGELDSALLLAEVIFKNKLNPRPPGVKGIWGMSPERVGSDLGGRSFRMETTA